MRKHPGILRCRREHGMAVLPLCRLRTKLALFVVYSALVREEFTLEDDDTIGLVGLSVHAPDRVGELAASIARGEMRTRKCIGRDHDNEATRHCLELRISARERL